MRATIDFAVSSRLHLAGFFITSPFPGTPIYAEFKALGKLSNDVNPIDHDYAHAPFNGSEVPDRRFRRLHREAYMRFYFRPGRIMRIFRDRPYSSGYGSLLSSFLKVQRVATVPGKACAPDIVAGRGPARRNRFAAER